MTGYDGFSMSNNAREAYSNGERPLSRWIKADILAEAKQLVDENIFEGLKSLSADMLKSKVLCKSSWHHTSSYYNKTNFYIINEDYLSSLTINDINELQKWDKKLKEKKKNKAKVEVQPRKVLAQFVEWEWHARGAKAKEIEEVGTIQGNWFYRDNGTKKNVQAKGFRVIKYLD